MPLGFVCFKIDACNRAMAAKRACGESLWDHHVSTFGERVLLGRFCPISGQNLGARTSAGVRKRQLLALRLLRRGCLVWRDVQAQGCQQSSLL